MSRYDLAGKVALVTGAARGIGYETARALHSRGAHVAVVDLDVVAAQRAATSIGVRAVGFGADVTDALTMESVVAQVIDRFGELDVLVANAGIAPPWGSVGSLDPETFDRVIDVNLLGVYRTVHAALPQITAAGGHVVVTSSIYSFLNGALLSPYAASKAAVEAFGRALRVELAPHGATASVAYFGFVDTALVRDALDGVGTRVEALFPPLLLRPISPEVAAAAVVRAIERRRARIIAPRRWIPIVGLRGLVGPAVDAWLVRNRALQSIVLDVQHEADKEVHGAGPQRPPNAMTETAV